MSVQICCTSEAQVQQLERLRPSIRVIGTVQKDGAWYVEVVYTNVIDGLVVQALRDFTLARQVL